MGLMACGVAMSDRHVLAAARAVEVVLPGEIERAGLPSGYAIDAPVAGAGSSGRQTAMRTPPGSKRKLARACSIGSTT